MLATIDTSTTAWFLAGANMVLCLGLAATFTPLMTSALGSVAPERYSHGSAALGTFQQVAGAAGTALFITVMTVVSADDRAAGIVEAEAITNGVRTVFTVAGVLSLLLIVIVCFVRRPKPVLVPDETSPAPNDSVQGSSVEMSQLS